MRNHRFSIPWLFLLACSPETDLRQAQTQPAADPGQTASAPDAFPQLDPLAGRLVEPPDGATGIPTNLASLVVRFTEPVQPSGAAPPFVLHSADGLEMPLQLGGSVPCAQTCYLIPLAAELVPSSLQTLESVVGGLLFLDGKPVPVGSAGGFSTGEGADRFAPRILSYSAEVSAGCVAVSLAADEPVLAQVVVASGDQTIVLPTSDFAPVVESAHRLPVGTGGSDALVAVRVVDRGNNAAETAPVSVVLPPPQPYLVITEILANSAGSETTQEFVEIYNAGTEAVALAGLAITDKSGSDALPAESLAPGAFAIVVAEKYDPSEGSDPAPRDGTLVLRVPGRIGADGLSNSGELVRLLGPAGDTISQYGGYVDVAPSAWSGKSVKRVSIEACDGALAWTTSPSAATPGW